MTIYAQSGMSPTDLTLYSGSWLETRIGNDPEDASQDVPVGIPVGNWYDAYVHNDPDCMHVISTDYLPTGSTSVYKLTGNGAQAYGLKTRNQAAYFVNSASTAVATTGVYLGAWFYIPSSVGVPATMTGGTNWWNFMEINTTNPGVDYNANGVTFIFDRTGGHMSADTAWTTFGQLNISGVAYTPPTDTWFHWELYYLMDPTAGAVNLRIDGAATDFNHSGIQTCVSGQTRAEWYPHIYMGSSAEQRCTRYQTGLTIADTWQYAPLTAGHRSRSRLR